MCSLPADLKFWFHTFIQNSSLTCCYSSFHVLRITEVINTFKKLLFTCLSLCRFKWFDAYVDGKIFRLILLSSNGSISCNYRIEWNMRRLHSPFACKNIQHFLLHSNLVLLIFIIHTLATTGFEISDQNFEWKISSSCNLQSRSLCVHQYTLFIFRYVFKAIGKSYENLIIKKITKVTKLANKSWWRYHVYRNCVYMNVWVIFDNAPSDFFFLNTHTDYIVLSSTFPNKNTKWRYIFSRWKLNFEIKFRCSHLTKWTFFKHSYHDQVTNRIGVTQLNRMLLHWPPDDKLKNKIKRIFTPNKVVICVVIQKEKNELTENKNVKSSINKPWPLKLNVFLRCNVCSENAFISL